MLIPRERRPTETIEHYEMYLSEHRRSLRIVAIAFGLAVVIASAALMGLGFLLGTMAHG
jgi:hypothetical protein